MCEITNKENTLDGLRRERDILKMKCQAEKTMIDYELKARNQ
jgi:hypothetical protein